jgi:hypothetical protein
MIAIHFPEVNSLTAEDQIEYQNLPAYHDTDEGTVTYCFQLNVEEMEQVKKTGRIWIKQLTQNELMQPIADSCLKEDLLNVE